MKIKLIVFFALLLISCKKGHIENYEDLQKVKLGMKLDNVLALMRNEPINVEKAYWDKNLFVYSFASPPAASDHYKVIFKEKDSTVVEVLYGE